MSILRLRNDKYLTYLLGRGVKSRPKDYYVFKNGGRI